VDEDLRVFLTGAFGAIDEQFRTVNERLDRIEELLRQHTDELTVTTGMAMAALGERIVWKTIRRQVKKLNARLEALEEHKP
jgi:hypothetical protein